eukprot:maker-scaffold14_size734282-snap-gene-6.26 protein:Tk11308 transcript:maker-scaffold14_size734282-snap-gene-6.26-mRNA-1 annotation:"allatotropin precursor"
MRLMSARAVTARSAVPKLRARSFSAGKECRLKICSKAVKKVPKLDLTLISNQMKSILVLSRSLGPIIMQRSSSSILDRLPIVTLLLASLIAIIVLESSEAGPTPSHGRYFHRSEDNRINRRGFKSSLLSTARGFGKRSGPGMAPLATPNNMDTPIGSLGRSDVPTYLLAEEASVNPRLLALLVNLLDVDGDGMISPGEVLRDEAV